LPQSSALCFPNPYVLLSTQYSVSPNGEQFPLPTPQDEAAEIQRLQGPGIGGYCLPKDGGLSVWSYQTLMGFEDDIFKITPPTPDLAEGKTGATPYFLAGKIGSCTGFSGPQAGSK
jgi:hypothetical protein